MKVKVLKWVRGKEAKRIVLILFFTNVLAASLLVMDLGERHSAGDIRRNSYGKGDRTEEYQVTVGDELKKEPFAVEVEERKYTGEEIREIFKKVIPTLDRLVLGENKSFDRVETNLNFVTALEEYPIQIQWEADNYEVINVYGEIQHEHTKEEGTMVEIRGTLTCEKEEALYVANAVIYPEKKNRKEKLLAQIETLVKDEDKRTEEKEGFALPDEVNGEKIRWSKKLNMRGFYVSVLGFVCAGLMIALQKQNRQKAEKERREQMITDYPEIINKFTLLLSTGMTVKGVWERIVQNYEKQKNEAGDRAAYEEMRSTYYEMKGGISEAEAYERFGKRCGVSLYMKFGALLSQNLRKGAKGMTDLLRMESIQAFENRKSRARRMGEEASTKLLVPMFGMLAVVLVIVVVPAFLSMRF